MHHRFNRVGGGGVSPGEQKKECWGKCLWEPHEARSLCCLFFRLKPEHAHYPVYTALGKAAGTVWTSLQKYTSYTLYKHMFAFSCKSAPNTQTQYSLVKKSFKETFSRSTETRLQVNYVNCLTQYCNNVTRQYVLFTGCSSALKCQKIK